MDKQEFLKQMMAFGQELLEADRIEDEQKVKINLIAQKALQRLYNGLDEAVNAAGDLERILANDKKKRGLKALKALGLIMKVQELMNPMAEDDDIDIV